MRCNAERLIEAIIATEVMKMQQRAAEQKQKIRQKTEVYVVTVSRDFGSMGKDVAQLLADTLEVRCCDRSILQEVARRALSMSTSVISRITGGSTCSMKILFRMKTITTTW